MKRGIELYNFKAFGQAIKAARQAQGVSRKTLGLEMGLAPRYIASIENDGQHPSLQIFYELVTRFDISVDQFFFPNKNAGKSTQRRQLDAIIDNMDGKSFSSRASKKESTNSVFATMGLCLSP